MIKNGEKRLKNPLKTRHKNHFDASPHVLLIRFQQIGKPCLQVLTVQTGLYDFLGVALRSFPHHFNNPKINKKQTRSRYRQYLIVIESFGHDVKLVIIDSSWGKRC